MRHTKRRAAGWLALAFGLLLAACGGSTNERASDSGNTNWLKACASDRECGDLSCLCGSCRSACSKVVACELEPAASCQGDASDSPAPEPEVALTHEDEDSLGVDLAALEDGSVVVVGGRGRTVFEQYNTYANFWLARLDARGTPLWEVSEPHAENASIGRSVAVTTNDEIVTLATVFDGNDTPALARFDLAGESIETAWVAPAGFTLLHAATDGGVFAAGSRLLEQRDGRPFTSVALGHIDPGGVTVWMVQRQGLDGSVSNAVSLDVDANGNLLVAGSLGTATDSNQSTPWAGKIPDGGGDWAWERSFEPESERHCDATAAVLTNEGDALVAGGCEVQWLRSYSRDGALQWEQRFPLMITSLAALADGGYAVGLGTREVTLVDSPHATLLRFDASHRLQWRAEQPQCRNFNRLVDTDAGLLALADCVRGYSLSRYLDP